MNDSMAAPASLLRGGSRTGVTALTVGHRQPIVMVLGMHRSGTSLCSHVLSALGVDMTDKVAGPGNVAPTSDNPKGHWERREIVEFHDRILHLFNQGFFSPTHDFVLPAAWWADPRVAEVRSEVAEFLKNRMHYGYFGFKDPRTTRLLPMWHQIVSELKLTPKIIFCLRNPAQVARSLHLRDGFGTQTGEYRWLSYNIDFFRYTKGLSFCTIEYESWFDDPIINLSKLRGFLDLPPQDEFDIDLAITQVVEHSLQHDDIRLGSASQPLIRSLYTLARRVNDDPAARDHIQSIAAQFVAFQQLQQPFKREFEEATTLAARLPALERETEGLRTALEKSGAQLEALAGQIKQIDAEIIGLIQQRDSMAAALEAARKDNESRIGGLEAALAERETAAATRQVEITVLREALAAAELQRQEGEAAAAAQQVEITVLREALAAAELQRQKGEAVAAAQQVEITELREALAAAERQRQEGEAAAAAQLVEITGLREALAAAERGRQEGEAAAQERAAAAAALEREIAVRGHQLALSLRDAEDRSAAARTLEADITRLKAELANSRQVGRAVIQTMAASDPVVFYRAPQLGWREAIRRAFGLGRIAAD